MKQKKNYNLLIGAATLLAIVTAVSLIGYAVSRPEPALIQGQAEARDRRKPQNTGYRGKFREEWKGSAYQKGIMSAKATRLSSLTARKQGQDLRRLKPSRQRRKHRRKRRSPEQGRKRPPPHTNSGKRQWPGKKLPGKHTRGLMPCMRRR